MAVESPKIDNRTYDQIVAQIEALAGRVTCVVKPTIAALLGRTLAQDIQTKTQTISSGTVIDQELAQQISQLQGLDRVRVFGWQGVVEVDPQPHLLMGHILSQDVIQAVPPTIAALVGKTLAQDIQQRAIATRGTLIDLTLAQRISQVRGLTSVDVVLAPLGTLIDADLAQQISQIPGLRSIAVRANLPPQRDAGLALIRIVARMATLVSDRLNRVPEKNFLAFLDLIGTQIHPPQPARVPLTFSLVENSPLDAFVPAGTQVAALTDSEDEVVFELEHELVVARSQLHAVYVRQPAVDRYSDNTAAANGDIAASYPVFMAAQPIEHCLYLACDELLTLPGEKTVTITTQSTAAIALQQLPLSWSVWDSQADQWKTLKGIVSGLTVNFDANLPEITVVPGTAINCEEQLQTLTLSSPQTLSLRDYFNQTVLVLLTQDTTGVKLVLRRAEDPVFDSKTHICLACLWVSNQGVVSHAPWSTLKLGGTSWALPLQRVQPLSAHTVNGQTAAWLRARLATPLPVEPTLPQIDSISLSVALNRTGALPDGCVFNTAPLDTSKPFYPFGEQPRFNDTFYLGNQTVFSQPGAVVGLQVVLANATTVKRDGGIELVWEIWNGARWHELGRSSSNNANVKTAPDFSDGTKALTQTTTANAAVNLTHFNEEAGRIKFKIPNQIAATTLGGEANYWIRARITQGHYGQAARTQQRMITVGIATPTPSPVPTPAATTPVQMPVYDLTPADFNPPVIESLSIAYTLTPPAKTANCLTYNDFTYANPTGRFRPFTPTRDRHPALYLGFDQPFPNRPITLYLQVESLAPGKLMEQFTRILAPTDGVTRAQKKVRVERVQGFLPGQMVQIAPGSGVQENHRILAIQPDLASTAGELTLEKDLSYTHSSGTRIERRPSPPHLVWEYASAAGWKSLGAIDETELLRERGLVRFIGPTDAMPHSEFGQVLYWLRLRWDSGEFLVQPRLRRLLPNTGWAAQVVTLTEEVLGSSTGNPNQRFFATHYPVLPGQVLEVREELSPAEQDTLLATDRTLLTIVRDESGEVEAVWVRWQEVNDFYGSGVGDRHYRLNHLTGEVQFGDGQRGKVPPLGRQNLRLRHYRSGGGAQGNVAAGAIAQLKTTVPYINAAVNLEVASGAADQESLERVKERGPKLLRHRGRAVTAQDIEDLAFEASPDVARARAIPPVFSDALDWLPTYHLLNPGPGPVAMQLTWMEDSRVPDLVVSLYGPGQATPYTQTRVSRNDRATFLLPAEAVSSAWRVTLQNPHAVNAVDASGLLTYSGQSQAIEFSRLSPRPHSEVVDAGRVDLIIVPRSLENQPTPSLGLLDRVETYIRERCVPTLALNVTEPDWVNVTVEATLVPTSFEGADNARERALLSLTRFLHPLTGGASGQGWDFGRQPRLSDLYALLESVDGIDFVKDLIVTDSPTIRADTPRNFLIYSGTHSLHLQLP